MIIKTRKFGDIEISSDSIINMPLGMLGISGCTRFVLLDNNKCSSLKWLQSLDEPALTFIVANPMDFFPDYDIELSDEDIELLEIDNIDDVVVVTTVSLDRASGSLTTNLMGPIVINVRNLRAKQIVLQDDRYSTRHIIGRIPNRSSANGAAVGY